MNSTIKPAYFGELQDAIELYAEEMAVLRRIKETTKDDDVRDAITGIIQDELTIMSSYRKELL